MSIVTISPKYQIVIPKEIREKMKLKPGQKLNVFEFNNTLNLFVVKDIKEARGLLKGMNTNFDREKKDRI